MLQALWPEGEGHGHRVADREAVVLRLAFRDQDLVLAERAVERSLGDVEVHHAVEPAWRDSDEVLLPALDAHLAEAQRDDVAGLGQVAHDRARLLAEARPAPGHHRVRGQSLVDARPQGCLRRRGEDRDQGHQPEPDHERGRGGRRPPRVAGRVAAGERARHAQGRRQRTAEHARQRPGEHRAHRDQAEEDDEDAEERHRHRVLLAEPALDPVERDRQAGRRDQHARDRPADERRRADVALLPIGDRRDRRDPGGPERGMERRGHRDAEADDEGRHDRPPDDDEAGVGDGEADRGKDVEQHAREPDAETQPDERAEEADDERLGEDGPDDLRAGTADRTQEAELAGPLRDEDRERVEDDEAADEQPDAGEAEERGVQEAEHLFDRLRGLGHDLRGAQNLDVGDLLPQGPCDSGEVGSVLHDDVERVEAVVAELPLRGAQVEGGEGERPEVGALAEPEDADDLVGLLRAEEEDADVVADRVPEATGGALVHRHLAVAGRRPPGRDPQRPDAGCGRPRDPDGRRAGAGDRVAVLVDDAGEALDEPVRLVDPGGGAGRRERRLGELGAVAALPVALERALVAHHEVDPHPGLGERDVERLPQRVGEDVHAGDERHAEHDRERSEREADLAGRHSLDRGLPDRSHSSGHGTGAPWPLGIGRPLGTCLLQHSPGAVAQWSEQGTHNPSVEGSIPSGPTCG